MFDYFPIEKSEFEGRVLVTGAGGCIGSWALALLTRAGIPVAAFDLTSDQRRPRLLLSEDQLAKVEWLVGDLSDPAAVMEAARRSGAQAIIHLAALQVPFCKADPIAGARVNVVGTVNVFEAARKLGIKRLAYASSIAAHGAMDGHGTLPTLYGAYKHCNEQTAKVYSQDWGVHSVGLRPGVVYGVGRDQGMTSKTTVAILAAAAKRPYTIPFRGPISWLHAGEVASAFVKAVSKERGAAAVFDINGVATTVEASLQMLNKVAPGNRVECSGSALPFPMDLSDEPVRASLGNYGSVPLEAGIKATYEAFGALLQRGLLSPESVA
ncbi:MAG TPA: NAD(P)-dependent oxidoreductase [Burkholderiales bacterium]|nr:NAD(P)-dependent oxidoreductase [Burkholderiales bacterium]